MINKVFSIIAKITINKPKSVLLITLLITLVMALFASKLDLELSWVSLAPKGDPSVEEYQEIIDNFPAMSNILVLVSGENERDIEEAVVKAEKNLNALDEYVNSVITEIDIDFMIENGLLLSDEGSVETLGLYTSNTNLSGFLSNFNKALVMETNNLKNKDTDKNEDLLNNAEYLSSSFRGIDYFFSTVNESINGNTQSLSKGVNKLILGDTYIRSEDGSMVLMTIQPTFDVMDYENLVPGVNAIIDTLDNLSNELDGVKYEVTGMHVVGRDEMASVESDSYLTMFIGLIVILLVMYLAFRIISAPILAFIPLLIGVIWDVGLTSIMIGRLNLLTAFTAIMLIGLGVDFSIHILSGYTEAISNGKSNSEAIENTLLEIGPSIFTGAITTAAAFLTLTLSSLEVLSELGFVMGIGIITTIIAVFFVLPSILVFYKIDNKRKVIKGNYIILGKIAKYSNNNKLLIGSILIILLIFMGYQGLNNKFDLNMMNLEPKGLESIRIMNKLVDEFGMSSEGILVEKDSLDEIYKLSEGLKKEKSVSQVSSIVDLLPKKDLQEKRIEKINEMKKYLNYQPKYEDIKKDELLNELIKFRENIKALSDIYNNEYKKRLKSSLDKLMNDDSDLNVLINDLKENKISQEKINTVGYKFYKLFSSLGKDMMDVDILEISDIPSNYKMQYISEDESKYLLTVYPSFEIWDNLDKEKGEEFLNMLRLKDEGFTGSPVFMKVLYDSSKNESGKVGILVFVTLFLIIFLHFKSFKYTIITFIPIIATILMTIGTMKLLGIEWNILNVLALPLIIGVGVDDAIHILHRYTSSNSSIKTVFSSVGRAILLTTITTMAGFGSLMFSSYRGMAYLGAVLFIGVGYAFLMTILIIPIFIKNRA